MIVREQSFFLTGRGWISFHGILVFYVLCFPQGVFLFRGARVLRKKWHLFCLNVFRLSGLLEGTEELLTMSLGMPLRLVF